MLLFYVPLETQEMFFVPLGQNAAFYESLKEFISGWPVVVAMEII